ncbi:AraC family transcriptional regulator [Streptomyces sp. NBC_01005]|uniref:helix-turn-helix domain-containing protein n=1 Tax=unclassified Streptomyces TaxID=2593676 RepID=UPI0038675434|nr:AraC family transcriptional regulator [Streptomyces sp. NBC_01005]WTC96414.1 AraC family transcriptional regulator [Streptomyces sp. NBC_01650]
MAGEDARPARQSVYVDARLDLAHRRVLASARTGDVDHAVTGELLGLLSAAVGQAVDGAVPTGVRPSSAEATLVAAARQAIGEAHPASEGLLPLAELLGVSPYRLSRAFTRELGVSLTRYRNRVRVGRALDRLEAGEESLATLAADLGLLRPGPPRREAHSKRLPGSDIQTARRMPFGNVLATAAPGRRRVAKGLACGADGTG